MRDTELYAGILGLAAPWIVEAVKLDTGNQSVEVKAGCQEGTLWASEAGERLPVYDHVERRWRHLNTCGLETLMVCRVPRVQTPSGKAETVPGPWAGPRRRCTRLDERLALEVLLACRSVSVAAELLGLSWDQLHLIMERAVKRGLERRELEELRHVGMDEKSLAKGQSDVSLLTDLDAGRVLEVMEGNEREAADRLLAARPEEAREAIEAVWLDRSGHCAAAARAALPEAALGHDRLPISAHRNDAVAAVHREENQRWQKLGDERLKGTPRLCGFDPDKLDAEPAVKFAERKGSDFKSARAWAIKEVFRRFWYYRYEGSARKFFQNWYGWASRRRRKPIRKVAGMLQRHFENIITSLRHPITNAVTEGLNSKIQAIKANARGFRSFFNDRTRILFFCGKLDLYPL
jgi:transposase